MIHRLAPAAIAVLVVFTAMLAPVSAQERDPLAPVSGMEAPQFAAYPEDFIAPPNAEAITALVDEARLFGVPVAVRVVSWPTDVPELGGFDDVAADAPIPDETMHEMARAWMAEEPIESSPGAADGFLMLVVVPEDHTRSSAVIEPAENALPLNGLTQANIDEVMSTLVRPSFADNRVSDGIRSGLSVFSYNNLFGKPEPIEPNELHEDLQLVAGTPLAGITALGSLALIGLAAWIARRPHGTGGDDTDPLSPFGAAALGRGRVGDAVTAGALLHLLRAEILQRTDAADSFRIDESKIAGIDDPFLAEILRVLCRNAGPDGHISPAAMRRIHELMEPARSVLENDLARRGAFNKDGRVEMMWLVLASALVGALALFTLIPSIFGMAELGMLAILLAALAIAGVLTWSSRRSWTTRHGKELLASWNEQATDEERAIYDMIAHQDVLISAQGGPSTPPTVNLVRTLRGIGAT